jgi:sugar phosphate isomerase/epimerase
MHASEISRRRFLASAALGACSLSCVNSFAAAANRKMTINLVCGNIGVNANQVEAIELAHDFGFESVEAMPGFLASIEGGKLEELLGTMKSRNLSWGAAGLPVEFRQDEEKFKSGLKELPRLAAALEKAGVTRVGTWLSPGHRTMTYMENFRQHTQRLKEVTIILRDHRLRLGLEHVATKTSRERSKFPFIHTIAEMNELIGDISTGNVGHVLDSWHWWQADENAEDILALKADDVVAADLNDAPANLPKEKQLDGQRELPMATGVIPIGAFLNALNKIGFDGPVRAEPFNKRLNQIDNEEACSETITAMQKAFELLK